MPLRLSKAVVGVKEEGTAYTFDQPGAGECFPAFDITVSPSADIYQRQESRQILDKRDLIPGRATVEIGFKIELAMSGSAGTAPHWDDAIMGCGYHEIVTASTSVVYKPWSTFDGATSGTAPVLDNPHEAVSVAVFEDGVMYALAGGAGNVKFSATAGEPWIAEFTFQGVYQTVADVAVPTPTGVATANPPTFLSASVETIGGVSTPFESLEYDTGNEVVLLADANNANGYIGAAIVNRRMSGRFDPDAVLVATDDVFADWRAGTTGAVSTATFGAAGNQIAFTAGRCQYRELSMADRGGFRTIDAGFDITTAAGASEGDSFSITLT